MGADQGLTRLFYDGDCGLCRGAVRFVARRERSKLIRFAPLGGSTFLRLVPESVQACLPDSLVVLTAEGQWLVRSQAVIHLLRAMGPGWRFLGACLTLVPRLVRDGIYRLLAWFRPSRSICPRYEGSPDDRFEP